MSCARETEKCPALYTFSQDPELISACPDPKTVHHAGSMLVPLVGQEATNLLNTQDPWSPTYSTIIININVIIHITYYHYYQPACVSVLAGLDKVHVTEGHARLCNKNYEDDLA